MRPHRLAPGRRNPNPITWFGAEFTDTIEKTNNNQNPSARPLNRDYLRSDAEGIVESRSGAVTVGSSQLLPPLSLGGAAIDVSSLRFHIPLHRTEQTELPYKALGQDTQAFARGRLCTTSRIRTKPRSIASRFHPCSFNNVLAMLRNPCPAISVIEYPIRRSAQLIVLSDIGRVDVVSAAKTYRPQPVSGCSPNNNCTACVANGTICSDLAFILAAGIRHSAVSKFTAVHSVCRSSPGRTKTSGARRSAVRATNVPL